VPPPDSAAKADESDRRLYSWVDGEGVVHYGVGDDISDTQRRSARVVSSDVTVIASEKVQAVAPAAAPAGAPPSVPPEGQSSERKPPGVEPELDAQGLPVPGTMLDTSATRASRAAGESQLDPAAVERRRQEELRRMNCKERDGVWTCG
jgi:hypothetical protein